ncbi:MAG: matrixin family metalloprotease [Acidobacteria bacterium]|nr:matrixin family metalloprotease [Acidobacteriota bacterium]
MLRSTAPSSRWLAGTVVLAVAVSLATPTVSGYQLVRGPDFVWAPELRPVGYWVANTGNYWLTVDEVVTETRAAFDTWQEPEHMGLSFSYRGKTNQRPFDFFDATNTVGFSTRERMSQLGLSEVTLAVTSWLSVIGRGVIAEADILVNPAYNWSNELDSGHWDLRTTLVHEAGHFLGLGHSGVGRVGDGGLVAGSSVMWPYTFGRGSSLGRTLTDDDVTGAAVLYPGPDAPTGRIHGIVHRASGELVRYAHVVAYEPIRDHTVGGWADGEGNFEIAGLPDGQYLLRVNPIPSHHSDGAYFFPYGRTDRDFRVTVVARLVVVSGGQATEINIEVLP